MLTELQMLLFLDNTNEKISATFLRYDSYGSYMCHTNDGTNIYPINETDYVEIIDESSTITIENPTTCSMSIVMSDIENPQKLILNKTTIECKNTFSINIDKNTYHIYQESNDDSYYKASLCKLYITNNGTNEIMHYFGLFDVK